jgi:hypothetical protein
MAGTYGVARRVYCATHRADGEAYWRTINGKDDGWIVGEGALFPELGPDAGQSFRLAKGDKPLDNR